jgi:predicted RNase H-like HicB family nuclease
VAHLLSTIGELEAENEALWKALTETQLYVLDGYFVSISPGVDVPLVGHCPTLHAQAQGNTFDEVVADLRDAMQVALDGRAHFGSPIPPKDIEAKCLD